MKMYVAKALESRKAFFESLQSSSERTSSSFHGTKRSLRFMESPGVDSLSRIRPIPPEKPKRTFAHDKYLALQEARQSPSSSRDSDVSMPADTEKNRVVSEEIVEEEQRAAEDEHIYDLPLTNLNGSECRRLVRMESEESVPPLHYASSDICEMFNFRLHRTNAIKNKADTKKNEPTKGEEEEHQSRVKRAILVRRKTLAEKKIQEEAFRRRRNPVLFEQAAIIDIRRTTGRPNALRQEAYIAFNYMPETDGIAAVDLASGMPSLFYPDFLHATRIRKTQKWENYQEFVISMTTENALRARAYCIRYLPDNDDEEGVYPRVFVIISSQQNTNFFFDLAKSALRHADDPFCLRRFLGAVVHLEFPTHRGSTLIVMQKDNEGNEIRSEIRHTGSNNIGKLSCTEIIRGLSVEWTTCMMASLLCDKCILIAGRTVPEVTRVCQMLYYITRPLEWPHIFVPCIPDNLLQICENPTPYLMGVLRHNLNSLRPIVLGQSEYCQEWYVFFDIEQGLINPCPPPCPHGTDLAEYRLETCLDYCRSYCGMPRAVTMSLIRVFKSAIEDPAGSDTLTMGLLSWYSRLFGQYKNVGCLSDWSKETKAALVNTQSDPDIRAYLKELIETMLFEQWIARRQVQVEQSENENSSKETGSNEALNDQIDKITELSTRQKKRNTFIDTVQKFMLIGKRKK